MPPVVSHLEKIGQTLRRWNAELKLTWGLAAFFGCLFFLSLLDLWLRFNQTDRLLIWVLPLGIALTTAWFVWRALTKKSTPDGIAASVEKSFPELDNHLINYLQLARNPEKNPLKDAYVRECAPKWNELDFRRMRDRKAHRRSRILFGSALVCVLIPFLFFGQAWGVAMWRTANPFTNADPVSLTQIVEVRPGNTNIRQGSQLVLDAKVKGFEGHEVRVEVHPGDASRTTYSLGRIEGGAEQTFSHRIPRVATEIRYRFRAGDANPTEWFTITPQPPPAFTDVRLTAEPPAYTGLNPVELDARRETAEIPAGSELHLAATTNAELENLRLRAPNGELFPLRANSDESPVWRGSLTPAESGLFHLVATDTTGEVFEEELPLQLLADRPPEIEILAPLGRTILPPGEAPQIEFRVSDDFGVAEIYLKRDSGDGTGGSPEVENLTVEAWDAQGAPSVRRLWKSESASLRGGEMVFRIVARDNRPDSPNESISEPIIFNIPAPEEMSKQREQLAENAETNLQRVIELQEENVAQTDRNRRLQIRNGQAEWGETETRQTEIRTLTRELLANPLRPLAGLTATVQQLYVNEMVLAIDSLKGIPTADGVRREALMQDALSQQSRILRQLRRAESVVENNRAEQQLSGLATMLDALIREQNNILEQTKNLVQMEARPGKPLVDAQDDLSQEFTVFLDACGAEARRVGDDGTGFARTIENLMEQARQLKISNEMILAAERLDQNRAPDAIPHEKNSLSGLETLQASLEEIRVASDEEKRQEMLDALATARDKLDKMQELHQTMRENMEQIRGQSAQDNREVDMFEEAYSELIANTVEALLEIPNDLHIFAELNAANDLVEDVFSIFEEFEQPDQSDTKPEDVADIAYTKNDMEEEILLAMQEAKDRVDAVEMWLSKEAEEDRITTEAFDAEQQPESGIAVAELATQVEDIIGELVEQDEDVMEAAADGSTNHSFPDLAPGWDILEGNLVSHAAQGKTGNQMPAQKEQDGRANIGRQGMSVGEAAAGSGTISEGSDIEARRTEDPTQSGQIHLDGEADTVATGGGKLGTGKADEMGMGGGAERMDSMEEGSWEGMAALMARNAEAIYAQSSLNNIRVDSLREAAQHLRQSADAVATGDIEQVREFRNMAVTSLTRARAQLQAGPSGAIEMDRGSGAIDNLVGSGSDVAPPRFRDQVADYFRALNEEL